MTRNDPRVLIVDPYRLGSMRIGSSHIAFAPGPICLGVSSEYGRTRHGRQGWRPELSENALGQGHVVKVVEYLLDKDPNLIL